MIRKYFITFFKDVINTCIVTYIVACTIMIKSFIIMILRNKFENIWYRYYVGT